MKVRAGRERAAARAVRRAWPVAATLIAAAVFTAGVGAAEPQTAEPQSADPPERPTVEILGERRDEARQLFLLHCSSCHGANGEGTDEAPSIESAGAAGAYYYLATGRMPMAGYEGQPRRKELLLSADEIELLVAYVALLSDGPALPDVDPAAGDVAEGGEFYRSNCASCHAAAGIGGALSYGHAAPTLVPADPLVIGAAVRAGPGLMPVFDEEILDAEALDSVVRYALELQDPANPGGATLGGAGPVPEGFVGWVFGVGALMLATFWIGRLHTGEPPGEIDDLGASR